MTVIGVRKQWNDEDNSAGRPHEIHVTLYADNEVYTTVKLDESNQWFVTIEVPMITIEGKDIHYHWEEHAVAGYILENTFIQEHITTFVNRVWERTEDTPEKGKKPKLPGKPLLNIDDYGTPLGVEIMINHVGDCFD
jgi:hypothetical protein